MDDSLATLVVVEALIATYPSWTDENGANVEQLAQIAVRALAAHGLLGAAPASPEATSVSKPSSRVAPKHGV